MVQVNIGYLTITDRCLTYFTAMNVCTHQINNTTMFETSHMIGGCISTKYDAALEIWYVTVSEFRIFKKKN